MNAFFDSLRNLLQDAFPSSERRRIFQAFEKVAADLSSLLDPEALYEDTTSSSYAFRRSSASGSSGSPFRSTMSFLDTSLRDHLNALMGSLSSTAPPTNMFILGLLYIAIANRTSKQLRIPSSFGYNKTLWTITWSAAAILSPQLLHSAFRGKRLSSVLYSDENWLYLLAAW
jgi:hypothetical protein